MAKIERTILGYSKRAKAIVILGLHVLAIVTRQVALRITKRNYRQTADYQL